MKSLASRCDRFLRSCQQRSLKWDGAWLTRSAVCAAVLAALAGVAGAALQQAGGTLQSSGRTSEGFAALPEVANPHPDPNRVMEDSMHQQDVLKRLRELNELRQKEMASDTQKLVALANALRAEMDKGNDDALKIDEIRKVEEIAKLAHGVQSKMRATIGN